ncbi:MAG: hypothetical protein KA347_09030 [Bacteroidia bacterium]|jgi:hypothetical protein|nr:hypothetical protein [Bacteroidota bacterium]MBP6512799.1 hypothetical protein [Bacteroidia bacterium]MBP7244724.1 hypothetical protein [Bacteroidia bacterium]
MKNLIIAIIGIAFSGSAFSQTDSSNKKMTPPDIHYNTTDSVHQYRDKYNSQDSLMAPDSLKKQHSLEKLGDGIMMRSGKMWIVKNNSLSALESTLTLNNEIKVSKDGTFTKKDGTKVKFKEGEHMDLNGNITPIK